MLAASSKLTGESKKQADKEIEIQQAKVDGIGTAIKKESNVIQQNAEAKKASINDYVQMGDAAAQAAQTIISSFEQAADREIAIREKRVERAREIADRGNAEALQEEERRLDQAMKQREKFARQQVGINLIMQASQIALAIATAAGETGVGAPIAIAGVLAALAAGFAAIKGFQNVDAFKDGVIDYQGKGTTTSDSNLVRISRGESVINAEATAKNREILQAINDGQVFNLKDNNQNQPPVFNVDNEKSFADLRKELKEIKNAIIERPTHSVSIDEAGIAVITERIQQKNRRRNNL